MSSEATPDTSDKSHINSAKPHRTTKTAKAPETHQSTDNSGEGDEPSVFQPASPNAPQTRQTTQETTAGDVPSTVAAVDPLDGRSLARETAKQDAHRRWRNEGIAERVAAFRDRKRAEHRKAHPKAKRKEGNDYAWACALAEFPPPGVEPPEPEASTIVDAEPIQAASAPPKDDQGVSGLGDLPPDWPTLPANASLQVEIAWVSANRLRVRDGAGVNLSKALSPAPSYSALSWLETSILFPSKFADISVKATANQDDEKESIRREKLSIEEVRSILAEMLEG